MHELTRWSTQFRFEHPKKWNQCLLQKRKPNSSTWALDEVDKSSNISASPTGCHIAATSSIHFLEFKL